MKRKKFRLVLMSMSPYLVVGAVFAVALVTLYGYRLTHLMPAAPGEQYTIQNLSQSSGLLDNPLLLPYKLITTVALLLPGEPLRWVRASSALVTFASVALFFVLARRWYGTLNGTAATVLFASSGWLLQTGRYGAGYSALTLVVLAMLNLAVWVNSTERSKLAVVVYAAAVASAICVPGGIWFALIATYICRQALLEHVREAGAGTLAGAGICFVIAITVLGQAFARESSLVEQWLGMPAVIPDITTITKQAALSITGFVARGPVLPEVWLAHTPLLDVAASALAVLGLLFYRRHLRNPRTLLLALFAVIGVILTALNGAAALSYLLPIVYLIIAGGFAFLLHQWKKVFPRNPIAEGVALSILGFMILCVIGFHTSRYFVAWHYSPSTVKAYRQPASSTALPYLVQ